MDIFLRLVLAHLLGDFVFQTDWVYKLKQSGPKGIAVHAGIVTLCFILMLWPYWGMPVVWVAIFINYALHWGQDIIKLESEKSVKHPVIGYCVDQVFHVGVVALVFFTSLKILPLPEAGGSAAIALYNSNVFIVLMIAVITATYAGHWFIVNLKSSYFKAAPIGGSFERLYGMVERFLMLAIIVYTPSGVYLSPLVLVGRYMLPGLKEKPSRKFDALLSGITGMVTGVLFSLII